MGITFELLLCNSSKLSHLLHMYFNVRTCGNGQSWTLLSCLNFETGWWIAELLGERKRRQWGGQAKGLSELCFLKKNHEALQMRSQELLRLVVNAEYCLRSRLGSLFVEGNNYTVAKVFTCQVFACLICTVFFHC